MRKFVKILLVLVAVLTVFYGVSKIEFKPSQKQFILIGSGGISGLYFRIAGQFCSLVESSKSLPQVDCSVQSTPGSMYNINALGSHSVDVVLAQDDWEYMAYNGKGDFKEPMPDLRLLARLYKEPLTIIARKDAGVRVISDMIGKRINIGAPGSGISAAMTVIMQQKGWTKADFKLTTRLKDVEQAQALCDNKIDVMVSIIGHPSGSVQEAMATCDVNFVHLDHDLISELSIGYPYYVPYRIPKQIYDLKEDIQTVAVTVDLVTTKGLSPAIAYGITKALVNKFDYLSAIHPAFSSLAVQDLVLPGFLPLHEGAKDFYKESGLLK